MLGDSLDFGLQAFTLRGWCGVGGDGGKDLILFNLKVVHFLVALAMAGALGVRAIIDLLLPFGYLLNDDVLDVAESRLLQSLTPDQALDLVVDVVHVIYVRQSNLLRYALLSDFYLYDQLLPRFACFLGRNGHILSLAALQWPILSSHFSIIIIIGLLMLLFSSCIQYFCSHQANSNDFAAIIAAPPNAHFVFISTYFHSYFLAHK